MKPLLLLVASLLPAQINSGILAAGRQGDITTGMVADWDLYNGSSTLPDLSGNGHVLTPTAGATWNPYLAHPGAAVASSFALSPPFTVVAIFQTATNGSNQILFTGNNNSPQVHLASDGTLRFAKVGCCGSNPTADSYAGASPVVMAVSYDGSNITWYKNGAINRTQVETFNFAGSTFQLSASSQTWAGTIYRVRIYNRVLSDLEVRRSSDYLRTAYSHRAAPVTLTSAAITSQQLSVKQYVAQQLAVSYCLNMSTFGVSGTEWATPNVSPDLFAPTALNIDQWLDAAVAAGAHSAMLTVKHHDGFALWPTATHVTGFSPYSIAQSSWYAANGSPDLVGLFVAKARARSLYPLLYFSIWDRTWEIRSNATAASDPAAYIAWIESQLNELLTNYGAWTSIVTDGWGWSFPSTTPGDVAGGVGGYTHIPFATINDYVKAIQPNILMIDNNHQRPVQTSDMTTIEIPFSGFPAGPVLTTATARTAPTEAWDVMTTWFWLPSYNNFSLASSATLSARMKSANSYGMLYLLNMTVDRTGNVPAGEVAAVSGITHN